MGKIAAVTSREEAVARRVCLRETKIFLDHFFSLEQRPDPSSFRQASRYTDPIKLPPSSARRQSPCVTCSLVSPRSRMLYPLASKLGKFGPCRSAEDPRWSLPGKCRAGSEGEVGSKVPYQPESSRNKIPLPNPFRSSRTSSVRSLEHHRERISPVGSLGHRRKISVTDERSETR